MVNLLASVSTSSIVLSPPTLKIKHTVISLTLGMLGKNFNALKVFLLFTENSIWHSMQIVNLGDNYREMAQLFIGDYKKMFQNVGC